MMSTKSTKAKNTKYILKKILQRDCIILIHSKYDKVQEMKLKLNLILKDQKFKRFSRIL